MYVYVCYELFFSEYITMEKNDGRMAGWPWGQTADHTATSPSGRALQIKSETTIDCFCKPDFALFAAHAD